MGKTQEIGKFGEDFTVNYLKKHGYKILERNYYSKFGEIDIIAANKSVIAFVEVKARGENALYSPREAVNFSKQQKCIKTAEVYLTKNITQLQPRFDVSEMLIKEENHKKAVQLHNYIENAF